MEAHDCNDQPSLIETQIAPSLMQEQKAKVFKFIQQHYHDLFRAEDHQGMYKNKKNGRTNIPPERLSCMLLLEYLTQSSDYEAMDRLTFDIRWKNVFGLAVDDLAGFDRTMLVRHRARLIQHGKTDVVFKRSIQMCLDAGLISQVECDTLYVDSMAIFGAGAVKDTYNLIGDGMMKIIRQAAAHWDLTLTETVERLGLSLDPLQSIKAQLDIDWSDGLSGRQALTRLVDEAVTILETVKSSKELQSVIPSEQLTFLEDIFAQDIEESETEPGGCQIWQGVAKDRIVSAWDTQMRHGRKSRSSRFDGHKVQVGTVNDSGIVVAVSVVPGNEPDGKGLQEIVKQAETNLDNHMEEIHADRAYDTVDNLNWLAESEDRQVSDLVCKPRRLCNGDRFTKADFLIDLEACTVECPDGQRVSIQVAQDGVLDKPLGFGTGGKAHFRKAVCDGCSQSGECRRKKSKSGRQILIHPYEDYHQKQREQIKTVTGRAQYRERVQIEHVIARLVNLGLRQARYRGLERTQFQATWVSSALNIRTIALMRR